MLLKYYLIMILLYHIGEMWEQNGSRREMTTEYEKEGGRRMPDRETQEKRQHSTTWIPYSYYECRLPEWFVNVPVHWHSELELIHIRQGRGEFICGSRKLEAEEGELLLVPPNMLHAAYLCREQKVCTVAGTAETVKPDNGDGGCDGNGLRADAGILVYDALVFHPVMLGMGSGDRCTNECIRPMVKGSVCTSVCIRRDAAVYEELLSLAERVFSCVHDNSARADLLLKSELLRLIWILEESGEILFETDGIEGGTETIRPALEYMAQHFREDITVERLAELVHLSKSHFMRCFRQAVGIGAIEHLSQLRIRAACEALGDSTEQIADIAFACGYSNLSNFNRQFLKRVGCSPKEYRKRNKPTIP